VTSSSTVKTRLCVCFCSRKDCDFGVKAVAEDDVAKAESLPPPSIQWSPHTVQDCMPEGKCEQGGFHDDLKSKWSKLGYGTNQGLILPGVWVNTLRVKGGVLSPCTSTDQESCKHGLHLNFTSSCFAPSSKEGIFQQPQNCWSKLQPCQDNDDEPDCQPLAFIDMKSTYELERSALLDSVASYSSSTYSVIGLYFAVVLVVGRYLRAAFQDSSKRAIYEEIPNVDIFLDLVTAVKMAREHRDLRTEFQLYYCLMKVLRSTNLLLSNGGLEPTNYGAGRTDPIPQQCAEPVRHQDTVTV